MVALWTFRCYVSARGANEIRSAYDSYSKRVQAKFASRLRVLTTLTRSEWTRPLIGTLFGPCEGLWEIRFEKDNVQHRPLGFFLDPNVFVICFWALEKGGRFDPPN